MQPLAVPSLSTIATAPASPVTERQRPCGTAMPWSSPVGIDASRRSTASVASVASRTWLGQAAATSATILVIASALVAARNFGSMTKPCR